VCVESKHRVNFGLLSICPSPSSPGPYIYVARSQGLGGIRYRLQYRHTIWTHISTSVTIGPRLTGLRGTHLTGSIIYTLVSSPRDSTRIADLGWISNLQIFDLINTWLLHIFKSLTWSFDLSFYYNVSQGVLMNKPDNSDGSRGQLTAETDTCHLLQIQSPWTWIPETGQTHSFAAFRTYKEWIPVVLRVPSASTRIFLRVVDTDKYQQSVSMCLYRTTQDGSWGLTFVIYFNHGIQVLSRWRNSRIIFRSLVW
jgi:hypothetical protein